MSEYIAESYAGVLTKEDVKDLFDEIEKRVGSRLGAAKLCRLTTKATYDWDKSSYIKLPTAKKVLLTSLNMEFLNTMTFLLNRCKDRTTDILHTILQEQYNDGISVKAKDEFKQSFEVFENVLSGNRGLIRDQIEDEIQEYRSALANKAASLGISPPEKTIDDFDARELMSTIEVGAEIYITMGPTEFRKSASKLGLPQDGTSRLVNKF